MLQSMGSQLNMTEQLNGTELQILFVGRTSDPSYP